MFLIHLLHFFGHMLSVYFLTSALFVLDVSLLFNTFAGWSLLFPSFLFWHKLGQLIFIKPRNSEGSEGFAKYFLDSGYSEKKEWIGHHPYIYILKLKNVFEVMLLVSSNIRDKCSFCFLDVIPIAYINLMHSFLDKLKRCLTCAKSSLLHLFYSHAFSR